MTTFKEFHDRSIRDPEGFWAEQAALIDWHAPFTRTLDHSNPPFARWYTGGRTNLCHNALDRHLAERSDQLALAYVSGELGQERTYTFAELHREVNRMAGILGELGVGRGDRVLIYLPMIPEAAFAMLACVRIGAIHAVVFGGFAAHSLAVRIDDAEPTVIVSADAGSRAGRLIPYKPILDEAIGHARAHVPRVLLVDRGLVPMRTVPGRDVDYAAARERHLDDEVPCEWLESNEPSYILYTSGTTGTPKGIQRDTGGHAVSLAASMRYVFHGRPGGTFFSTGDIGWVVGHSYVIYGPLLAGMGTVMYEGTPVYPDAGTWWRVVERFGVTVMFSAPTAIRVLKAQDPRFLREYDLSSLEVLFLAGEPLDGPTARWIGSGLGKPVIDNYWQTETGWPILAVCHGVENVPAKFGSPGLPVYGFDVRLLDERTGAEIDGNGKGVLAIEGPLPPGCATTLWREDGRFVDAYWRSFPGRFVYSTFDWAVRDAQGYYFILGRTDDVINVAGHRLGTREIEEAVASHPFVAEVAVVGVADEVKGQAAIAFAVATDETLVSTVQGRFALEAEVIGLVRHELGPVAAPERVHFVPVLPKTRAGKVLRRSIQAVSEGRDPGDVVTIEDPSALEWVRTAVAT